MFTKSYNSWIYKRSLTIIFILFFKTLKEWPFCINYLFGNYYWENEQLATTFSITYVLIALKIAFVFPTLATPPIVVLSNMPNLVRSCTVNSSITYAARASLQRCICPCRLNPARDYEFPELPPGPFSPSTFSHLVNTILVLDSLRAQFEFVRPDSVSGPVWMTSFLSICNTPRFFAVHVIAGRLPSISVN